MRHPRRSERNGSAEKVRGEAGLPIFQMKKPTRGTALAAVDGARTAHFEFVDALSMHCED